MGTRRGIYFVSHVLTPPLDKADLIALSLMLMANSTSLEVQVTSIMTPYATSAYSAHSLVSTISVIQGVVNCKSFQNYCSCNPCTIAADDPHQH